MRAPHVELTPRLRLALGLFALLLAAWGARGVATQLIAAKLRATARANALDASWGTLQFDYPADLHATSLALVAHATGDTVMRAGTLHVALSPLSLLMLHPTPGDVELFDARLASPPHGTSEPDSLDVTPEPEEAHGKGPVADKVRREANDLVRFLLLPARRLPRLRLRSVSIERRALADEPARALHVDWLDFETDSRGVRFASSGALVFDQRVRYDASLRWGNDDRLQGGARFLVPDPEAESPVPLRLSIDGLVTQDRRAGVLRIADSTRITIGRIALNVSGEVSRQGPALSLRLASDGITEPDVFASLPRPVLGPLHDLVVTGSWDYRLAFDLDLAHPDDVDFDADVIPHDLQIDDARSRLRIVALDDPFVATIHLPHDRVVQRDLSPANPHYRPLDTMDSLLVHAVVTNEDGGFFRHHGFNADAVKASIAANLRAGAYKRGAGTITMQLARNLYLGHERTLSRKAQEVTLAWVLEHLTYTSKRRLLEIYLNIIEWGPEVHGADEAAAYYFGTTAKQLTLAQSLFLTTVIPSPTHWMYRFDRDGALRPFERAQMHFIGRAMVSKGWLTESELPPTDSLNVALTGPARDVLFARAGGAAPAPPDTSVAVRP